MGKTKDALLGAINEVQNLHTYDADLQWCEVCEVTWPCPTLLAINKHYELHLLNPCHYTMRHTRNWCGYPMCREG